MDIYRAQKIAEDRATDPSWNKSFVLVGPSGLIECEWLDPHFGLFQFKGKEGFVMVKQIPADIDVVMPPEEEAALLYKYSHIGCPAARYEDNCDRPGACAENGRCLDLPPLTNNCERCTAPTANPENAYGEFICDDCLQNAAERAYERHCEDFHDGCSAQFKTLQQQQIEARRLK